MQSLKFPGIMPDYTQKKHFVQFYPIPSKKKKKKLEYLVVETHSWVKHWWIWTWSAINPEGWYLMTWEWASAIICPSQKLLMTLKELNYAGRRKLGQSIKCNERSRWWIDSPTLDPSENLFTQYVLDITWKPIVRCKCKWRVVALKTPSEHWRAAWRIKNKIVSILQIKDLEDVLIAAAGLPLELQFHGCPRSIDVNEPGVWQPCRGTH